jgi:structural maintenance of chromosome 2
MIEEAAGTRMFETKKQAALKTIAKKETKVEEISKVLNEEITPTLEVLRKDRAHYLKWTTDQAEIERLTKFTSAYDYYKAQETLQSSRSDLESLEEEKEKLRKESDKASKLLNEKKSVVHSLLEKQQSEAVGVLKQMEGQVNKISKEYVKLNSEWKHATENLETEKKTLSSLKKHNQEVKI